MKVIASRTDNGYITCWKEYVVTGLFTKDSSKPYWDSSKCDLVRIIGNNWKEWNHYKYDFEPDPIHDSPINKWDEILNLSTDEVRFALKVKWNYVIVKDGNETKAWSRWTIEVLDKEEVTTNQPHTMSRLIEKINNTYLTPEKEQEIVNKGKELMTQIETLNDKITNLETDRDNIQMAFNLLNNAYESGDPKEIEVALN